jgi:hypothetical protein
VIIAKVIKSGGCVRKVLTVVMMMWGLLYGAEVQAPEALTVEYLRILLGWTAVYHV